jgi:hypothetical protein
VAVDDNTILLGDLNLDWNKKNLTTFAFKNYFEDLEALICDMNLTQVVNFPTRSRVVNNVVRESIIDHIYAADPKTIQSLYSITPISGDHLLLLIECDKM